MQRAVILIRPRIRLARTSWCSGRTTRLLSSISILLGTIITINIKRIIIMPTALQIAVAKLGKSQRITNRCLKVGAPPRPVLVRQRRRRHPLLWLQGSTQHHRANLLTQPLTLLLKCPRMAMDIIQDSNKQHQTCNRASASLTSPRARLELGCTARTTAL